MFQEKEVEEKNLAIEHELQAKRISTFQSKLNQRKLGPQNRTPVWEKTISTLRRQSTGSQILEADTSPVVKNGPVVFSTRSQNIILDAVANGESKVTVGRNAGQFSKGVNRQGFGNSSLKVGGHLSVRHEDLNDGPSKVSFVSANEIGMAAINETSSYQVATYGNIFNTNF